MDAPGATVVRPSQLESPVPRLSAVFHRRREPGALPRFVKAGSVPGAAFAHPLPHSIFGYKQARQTAVEFNGTLKTLTGTNKLLTVRRYAEPGAPYSKTFHGGELRDIPTVRDNPKVLSRTNGSTAGTQSQRSTNTAMPNVGGYISPAGTTMTNTKLSRTNINVSKPEAHRCGLVQLHALQPTCVCVFGQPCQHFLRIGVQLVIWHPKLGQSLCVQTRAPVSRPLTSSYDPLQKYLDISILAPLPQAPAQHTQDTQTISRYLDILQQGQCRLQCLGHAAAPGCQWGPWPLRPMAARCFLLL